MTDDDLDAALELRRQHLHNRRTLGFSYYETNHGGGGRPSADNNPQRANRREYMAAWRARKREANK